MQLRSQAPGTETGSLWQKAEQVTQSARQTRALKPIDTRGEWIRDGVVNFLVRVASSEAQKAFERARQRAQANLAAAQVNPFLPYDPRLFVSDISDTHLCLLNKYQVMDNHVLLVTRAFESQETLLALEDFEALWRCLAEKEALAFYNGGKLAGASQPHKHLQLIALPLTEPGPAIPIAPLLDQLPADGSINQLPVLPFTHRALRQPYLAGSDPRAMATDALRHYRALLQAVGLNRIHEPPGSPQAGPYNLLATREWMMVIPRSAEFYQSISINALGFAGTIFVRDEEQMALIKKDGPLTALRVVT
jgi:sulfate adenylyltransferase (ADP) / ATP adenylyltransferase